MCIRDRLEVKEKYADKRRTQVIKEEHARIEVDESEFVVASECTVIQTRNGNLKRMTQKALQKGMEAGELEEKFQPALLIPTDTAGKLYIFTNRGNIDVYKRQFDYLVSKAEIEEVDPKKEAAEKKKAAKESAKKEPAKDSEKKAAKKTTDKKEKDAGKSKAAKE